jgi:hypothetical protein
MKTIRCFLVPLLIAALAVAMAHAEVVKGDAMSATGAVELATLYTQDKKTADAKYSRKPITVKGVVCRIAQELGSSTQVPVYANIYLQTAPGLPLIKIELAGIAALKSQMTSSRHVYSDGDVYSNKHILSVRIANNILEARVNYSHQEVYGGQGSSGMHSGAWEPIVKCGDTVIIRGICKGKLIYIDITDATL